MLMEDTASQLARARQGNDPDQLAEALTNHANSLIEGGQIAAARMELDEAASIHHRFNRVYDEARCTHLAATLCRLEGNIPEARKRTQRADRLAEPGTPVAVSVATEYGEIALAEMKGLEAAAAYQRAIDQGQVAGLNKAAKAALLRRRANALVMSGKHHDAAKDLQAAYRLLVEAGNQTSAIRVLVEKTTVLYQGGDFVRAEQTRNSAMQEAQLYDDNHALSDLYLLQSTMALKRQDLAAALEAAQAARSHALTAIAPLSYVSAVLAIAEMSEASKNHFAAYEALASGWATVGDLLGQEAAKGLFEPKLLAMRQNWGVDTFSEVKSTYEAQRRAVI